MRAQEQADVDVVAEIDAGDLVAGERVAVPRDRHDEGAAATLELQHVRARDRRLHLFGVRTGGAAELHGREAVAVRCDIHVLGAGVEAGPDHDPELAVRIDPGALESGVRRDKEVAGHLSPREMELVFPDPHVRAGRGQAVGLRGGVVAGGPRKRWRTDVAVRLEVTETGFGSGARREGDEGHEGKHAGGGQLHGRGLYNKRLVCFGQASADIWVRRSRDLRSGNQQG